MWMTQMDTQVSKLKQVGLAILVAGVVCATASANDRDKAKRIHDRIAGVPPSDQVLDQMEQLVAGGDASEQARQSDLFEFRDLLGIHLPHPHPI